MACFVGVTNYFAGLKAPFWLICDKDFKPPTLPTRCQSSQVTPSLVGWRTMGRPTSLVISSPGCVYEIPCTRLR
jgi:hypothetical protein